MCYLRFACLSLGFFKFLHNHPFSHVIDIDLFQLLISTFVINI
jgi:hypothetical protein